MKKILCFLIVLSVLTSLFACGNGNDDTSSTDSSTDSSVLNETSEETTSEEEVSIEPIDYGTQLVYENHSFTNSSYTKIDKEANDEYCATKSIIIKNFDELLAFKQDYKYAGDNFVGFIDGLSEDNFKNHGFILANVGSGDTSKYAMLEQIYIKDNKLTIIARVSEGGIADMAMKSDVLIAKVDQDILSKTEHIEIIKKSHSWFAPDDSVSYEVMTETEFETTVYDGSLNNFVPNLIDNGIKFGALTPIFNTTDMANYIFNYSYSGEGKDLTLEYPQYDKEFFKDKFIIAVPVTAVTDAEFKIEDFKTFTAIYWDSKIEGIYFEVIANCLGPIEATTNDQKIIFITVDKSILPENCIYHTYYKINK